MATDDYEDDLAADESQQEEPREGSVEHETMPHEATPRPQAEAGIYLYEGEMTEHPVLGVLRPGDNDFTAVTHPEVLEAIQQMVDSGDLRKA